jgi:hypothetical protein
MAQTSGRTAAVNLGFKASDALPARLNNAAACVPVRTSFGRTEYAKHLMKKGEQFFRFPIGVWRSYSQSRAITEEIDHDRTFRISIADLDRIIKDFKVDIMHRGSGVGVMRDETPKPVYTVMFADVPGDDSAIRFIEVDGVTGQILSQTVKCRTKD